MAKVKIPDYMSPYKVTINGETFTYPAGSEVDVPDEVAAVINANAATESVHDPKPNKAVADMDQEDPFAPDFVQNRTHYKYTGKIVEEMVIDASSQNTTFTATSAAYVGETYVVHWGDEAYTCVGLDPGVLNPDAAGQGVILGFTDLDSNEPPSPPFMIGIFNDGTGMRLGFDESKEITFSIDGPMYHKLPKQYYDYGVFYVDIASETVDNTTTYSTEVTVGEVANALNEGKTLIARVFSAYDVSSGSRKIVEYFTLAHVFGYENGAHIPLIVYFRQITGDGKLGEVRLLCDETEGEIADNKYSVKVTTIG